VPGIHVFASTIKNDVDGRASPRICTKKRNPALQCGNLPYVSNIPRNLLFVSNHALAIAAMGRPF
jgi:hypothetical protein